MAATAGALASFADAATLLDELAGVQVPTKQVERTAEATGHAVARAESAFSPEDEGAAPAPTVYLGIDGTVVPMRRSETQGRAGKQPDGSARTREAKIVSARIARQRDARGRPVRDPGSISYSARIDSGARRHTDPEPSAFERRLLREARRRVILGDGARWIWRVAREHFPGAIEIVYLFHAKERLWDLSKTLYRGDAERVEAWAEARCSELDDGSMDALLQHLGEHAADCDEARQCRGYFHRNRERMRYPEFRAQGQCVGSGVVEAGCKTVAGTRLKRPGMHWTLDGANAILALRSCYLRGRSEDFWADFRAEQPVASQA